MNNEDIPQDKAELIAHIEREWTALLHILGKIAPRQMTTPNEQDRLVKIRNSNANWWRISGSQSR